MLCEIVKGGLETLSQRFVRFAQRECHVSPLYERLSRGIAQDPEILAIAAQAQAGQPVPNLFLAAVHFMLLTGVQHPLAAHYPSLSVAAPPEADPYPSFRACCLEHREAMLGLLSSRLVQTNEVRRCACLLPAFAVIAARHPGRPLALVEIGASAGLNLLWDHYGYDYGEGRRYGDADASVRLRCTLRGAPLPTLPATLPEVARRVGIDLNPIDVRDPDAALWLRALIWPDERGRAELLEAALGVAQQNPPTLLAGHALDRLPEVLAAISEAQTLCVFHTHTVNQFPVEERTRLSAVFAEQAATRDLYRLSIEWLDEEHPRLELVSFVNGTMTAELLAHCGSHGEWIEWLWPAGGGLDRGGPIMIA